MASTFVPLDIEQFLPAYTSVNAKKDDPLFSFYGDRVPPGYTEEFPISTYLKREFNELQLEIVEPPKIAGQPFKPMNHQSFMSRFMSPHTPYEKMLIFNEVGTGKTCLASLVSETAQSQNPNLLESVFLVKNEVLQKNLIEEIATVCTDNKYKPSPRDPKTGEFITSEQYIRRLNKNISQSWIIETFERFAKELAANDDEYIKEVYSNRYIFIDEAHNLRIQPKETDVSIYRQMFRFLHTAENCKIILMTATPMRDRPIEIASLLNLLLPDDPEHQFDLDTFMKKYFTGPSDSPSFNPAMRAEFKSKIRGIVSFVRAMSSDVKRIYEGQVVSTYLGSDSLGMKRMPLYIDKMSEHQSLHYSKAYALDRPRNNPLEEIEEEDDGQEEDRERSGLYKNSRQASLFVAPDGSYGNDMEPKWVTPSIEEMDRRRATQKSKIAKSGKDEEEREEKKEIAMSKVSKISGKFKTKSSSAVGRKTEKTPKPLRDRLTRVTPALRKFISGDDETSTNEEKLERLGQLSSKYASTIRSIINNPSEKAFVYSNIVAGGGANLFAALLELFDFSHVNLPDPSEGQKFKLDKYRKPKQFLLITGSFPTARQANFLVNKVFNHPDNKYGDYIQVIVASKIVGEGSSFKQARQFHNITPGWNETETTQAQGRVIRAFSHMFPDSAEKFIKIYRHCSMPINPMVHSIDFDMYKLSEDKDIPIKQIERLLKEAAVDCAINVRRNMQPQFDSDNSRECDYSTCVYQCDDVPAAWYGESARAPSETLPSLINDSYNLYYANNKIQEIKETIVKLFQARFMYDLNELQRLLPEANVLVLIRALKEIIDKSVPIPNRFNIISYLRESSNFYFLVDNHEFRQTQNLWLLTWYNEQPVLKQEMSFADYVTYYEHLYLPEKLDRLGVIDIPQMMSTVEGRNNLNETFRLFDPLIQEKMLETFWQARQKRTNVNTDLVNAYIDIYKGSMAELSGGVVVSSIMQEDEQVLRCYDPQEDKWEDCDSDEEREYSGLKTKIKETLSENIYGYYGIKSKNKFKIATVRKNVRAAASTGKVDKRIDKQDPGQVCGTGKEFKVSKLISMMLIFGDIAEKNGDSPPTIKEELDMSKDSEKYQRLIRDVTPKKVYDTLDAKFKEDREAMPEVDLEDIEKFDQEKLGRWYTILKMGTKKVLCSALEAWFKQKNLLISA